MNDVMTGGRYRLEQELGRGAMGSVWRARHEALGVRVAIKLMHAGLRGAYERARFEREARILGRLRSRYLPLVTDCSIHGPQPFMVMELLEGEDLGATLRREGALDVHRLCGLVEQVAEGLEVIHAAGVVHRDLKPSNIFLHAPPELGGEQVAKIIDFGVARIVDEDDPAHGPRDVTTTPGTLVGSPRYMSPEQIHGEWDRVDHRADLWSLAVILYQCLSGRLPFPGDNFPVLVMAVCDDDPHPLPPGAPVRGPSLDAFFRRALAKLPEERFSRATEMAEAFATALGAVSAVYPVALGWPGADECPTVRAHTTARP